MRAKDLISAFQAAANADADDLLMTLIFRGNVLRCEDDCGSTILHKEVGG